MATEIGELIVKIDLDNTQFARSITGLNRQMRQIESEFKAATSTLDKFEDASKRQKLQAQALAKQIELQKQKIALLRQSYDELVQTKGKDAAETQKAAIRLNNAVAALGRLETELKNVNQELDTNQRKFRETGNAAGKASRDFKGLEASAGALAAELGAMAAVAGAVAAGFAAFRGLRVNAQLENAAVAFETLTGSAEKAKEMLERLREIGAESPFNFEGLQQSAKLLLSMGIDVKNVVPYMTALADAVAAVGGGSDELQRVSLAIAQISAKGKVSAEEMNQLAENGIPAWLILSEEMGKSTQELMKMGQNGKLFSKDVLPLLIRGLEKKFGGAMKKTSETFDGMLEQIKEQSDIVLGNLFEPMFKSLEKVMPKVIDFIKKMNEDIKKGGLQEFFKNLLPKRLQDNFVEAAGWWDAVKIAIEDGDARTLGALMAKRIQDIFKFAWEAVQPYIEDLKNKMGQIDWGKAIIEGIKLGRDFVGGFVSMFDQKLGEAIQNGDMGAIGRRIGELIGSAISSIGDDQKSNLGSQFGNVVVSIVKNVDWKTLGQQSAGGIAQFISGMFQGAWSQVDFKQIISNFPNMLLNAFTSSPFGMIIAGIAEQIRTNFGARLKAMPQDAKNILEQVKNNIYRKIYETVLNVKQQAQDLKQSFYKKLFEMVQDARQKANDIKEAVYKKILDLVKKIKSINLVQVGKDIIAGLGKGLMQAAGSVYEKAEQIASNIKSTIKEALKIKSPSRVMIEIGQFVGAGLAEGMRRSLTLVSSQADRMAQVAIPSISGIQGMRGNTAASSTHITIHVNGNNSDWMYQLIRAIRGLNLSNSSPNIENEIIRALRHAEAFR